MSKVNKEVKAATPKEAFINSWIEANGFDIKAANAAWVEARPEAGTGFAATFYAKLAEAKMSDEDFKAIIDAGSNNVQNHRSHYDAIRILANKIWASKK